MEKYLERIRDMKVEDVMENKFVINHPTHTIREVSKDIVDMKASESIIIDPENNRVLGIVTLRDIVLAIGEGLSPNEEINKIMTKNIIFSYYDEPLEEALLKMAKYNISRLPIINQKKEIIGVLSEKRLLKVFPVLYELFEEIIDQEEESLLIEEENKEIREGVCENCEQYSDELRNVDGKWICPTCYENFG